MNLFFNHGIWQDICYLRQLELEREKEVRDIAHVPCCTCQPAVFHVLQAYASVRLKHIEPCLYLLSHAGPAEGVVAHGPSARPRL